MVAAGELGEAFRLSCGKGDPGMLPLLPGTTQTSTPSGEFKDTDRCCWKHRKCTGHIIHPFTSDYGHHDVHLHSISHCDCDSR